MPRISRSVDLGFSLRVYISYEFSDVADFLLLRDHFGRGKKTESAGAQALISEEFCPYTLVRKRL